MGIFDGILICSDWDGTLHSTEGVSENNLSAIRYFQESGGLFTVCSGRPLPHLKELFVDLEPNTYTITLNGAVIADHKTDEIVYQGFLSRHAVYILKYILTKAPGIATVFIHYDENGTPKRIAVTSADDAEAKTIGKSIYKIVFVTNTKDDVKIIKQLAKELDTEGYALESSWETSVELLAKENTKGEAVLRLKQITGARTLITVGDYENDINMLSAADVSYAVENAADFVKPYATYTTVSVQEGAIAAIITDLEQKILSARK